ncbi:MAG: Crp/Fnr family transcriptional regulator [Ruminococcus sp.]|nr:Crp/Fnr family transcriptional regulator [Ruminococcus sp.]
MGSMNYNYKNSEVHRDMQVILEKSGIVRSFPKGTIIYRQGDMAEYFCYLKKGRVKVFMNSADGMEKILNTATHGEILGEGAFFDKKPRVSSARAVVASELIMIDEESLMELIKKYPRIAFELLEILSNRIRLLSAQIDAMTFMQADARIAQLLIESEAGGEIKLTHEEMAAVVGVSRVTVSKILGKFVKSGIISTEYGRVIIKNRDRLSEIVVK